MTTNNLESENVQKMWNQVVKYTKEAATQVLETNPEKKDQRKGNSKIQHLSEKQKEIKKKIDQSKDRNAIQILKKERNQILNTIHKELKQPKTGHTHEAN